MTLIEDYHAEHKARLRRFAAAAIKPKKVCDPVPGPAEYPSFNVQTLYYHHMWFYDLVTCLPAPDEHSEVEPEKEARDPRIDEIIKTVAQFFGVSRLDIISARRTAEVVWPRQIACYLSKTLTVKSLPEIGRRIGGRDHTTILHAVRKIDRLRATDAKLESDLHAIAACLAVSL